jgi:predicted ribosome quality control (RQC) complex YloA/Tae2 family protein
MTSGDGFEILYGENSQSNDYLTTKVAKPNDWWLHARSITGAHVVIRTANRPDAVPLSTIRQAAAIAAGHSDAKHSSLVPVDYTLRKFVRKPRAAAPGLVTYQREKTIDVTPEGR